MDSNNYNENYEIDLIYLIKIVIRKWYVILILMIITGVLGYFYSSSIQDKYTADSSFIVEVSTDTQSDYNDVLMGQRLVGTYKEFIKSNRVIEKVITELNLSYSLEEMKEIISVSSRGDTLILEVSASTYNQMESYEIVNKTVEIVVNTASELSTLNSIELLDKATLKSQPDSNNKLLYFSISIILGGMLGGGIILLTEFSNKKLRSESIIEEILNLKVLAVIPNYDVSKLGS